MGEKKDVPLRRALQTIPATESNLGGDFLAYVYGPVPSWRLGRSLGIDLLSVREKTCPFDCIYCQLGRTVNKQIRREKFIDLRLLQAELETIKDKVRADYATFSGTGEPTLVCNLGKAI